MIILFDERETEFSSMGLGSLKDATKCTISEELNAGFTLELEYPINGINYSKLKEKRIIYCKPNPYDESQAFRITSISRPIKGIVTVLAVHISYDMNGFPVRPIDGKNLNDVLDQLSSKSIIENKFKFRNHVEYSTKTFKTSAPYNMRALFMGDDESIVSKYEIEMKFNNYVVDIYSKRGKNRNAKVVYGHNMTDLKHESNIEKLYNGLYPYYCQEQTSTETTTTDEDFTKAYIVGSKPYVSGWLSFNENGDPYIPMDESPVQIMSEGNHYQEVVCWDTRKQRYITKVYNEQVVIIQGLIEPSWLSIDWSNFPNILVKAARVGYFKKMTDTDWGDLKGVGDVVFEGSLLNLGSFTDNLIIYYSEVIPSMSNKENEQNTSTVLVELDEPIIWINTKDTNYLHNKYVLSVNFAGEFDEEPTKDQLKQKAEEYINNNKLGYIKHTTTVSFVDLALSTEGDKYQNFDHVELGDTVQIVYEDLGVNTELRVMSVKYNALNGQYEEITLGEKEETFTGSSVSTGDSVKSLTNDVGYSTTSQVEKLIAKVVTAEYIEATNAKMSQAQIKQLSTERLTVNGILEASQFAIDELVAKLLTAENAYISNVLQAGTVKIDGNITAKTGNIGGFVIDENSLSNGDLGKPGSVVVSTGTEGLSSISGSPIQNGWVFTAGDKFGVDKNGYLYAEQGTFNNIIIRNGRIDIGSVTSQSLSHSDDDNQNDTEETNTGFSVDDSGNVNIFGSLNVYNEFGAVKLNIADYLTVENGITLKNIKLEANPGSTDIEYCYFSLAFDVSEDLSSFEFYSYSYENTAHSAFKNVPQDTLVAFSYTYLSRGREYTGRGMVKINKGTHYGSETISLPVGARLGSWTLLTQSMSYTSVTSPMLSTKSSFIPKDNNLYDLGSSTNYWRNLYLTSNLTIGSTTLTANDFADLMSMLTSYRQSR